MVAGEMNSRIYSLYCNALSIGVMVLGVACFILAMSAYPGGGIVEHVPYSLSIIIYVFTIIGVFSLPLLFFASILILAKTHNRGMRISGILITVIGMIGRL